MRVTKYRYLYVLQGNYGFGWEDICQSEKGADIRPDLKAYRENAPEYRYRIVHRRELKQCEFVAGTHHSMDRVIVYVGRDRPILLCGFHASAEWLASALGIQPTKKG
jgi:hypothetical protein